MSYFQNLNVADVRRRTCWKPRESASLRRRLHSPTGVLKAPLLALTEVTIDRPKMVARLAAPEAGLRP